MKIVLSIISIFMIVGVVNLNIVPAIAQAGNELSPEEILNKSDLSRGNSTGLEWIIEINSVARGKKQTQKLKLKASGNNSLAEFMTPAKVKGRKLLMKERNMWFIKPGLSRPIPISPRQKLLGGASNGDIASTNYAGDYSVTSLEDGKFNGEECYLFDLKAKNKKVTYDRIRYWISKKRLIGVKAEFFTISGKMFKTATFKYDNTIKLNGKSRLFVSEMEIRNTVQQEDVTIMKYSKVKVKRIPASAFNLNLLVR